MLILARKLSERIRLLTSDGPIWITVCDIDRGEIRIGVEAPKSVPVHREELLDEQSPEKPE